MEYFEDRRHMIQFLNLFIRAREYVVDFNGTALEYVIFTMSDWNRKHKDDVTFFDLDYTDDQYEILNRRYMTKRLNIPDITMIKLLNYKEEVRRLKRLMTEPPDSHQ